MAFLRNKNKAIEIIEAAQLSDKEPKKIVIIAGPTFGSVLGFLLAGAVLGAAGALYLKRTGSTPKAAQESFAYDFSDGGAKDKNQLVARANALMRRVKSLSSRARDAVQSVSEAVSPAVHEAVEEGKSAAAKTERELHEELEKV